MSKGSGNPRRERLSRLILDHLSEMLRREVKDPRASAAGLTTVNHVELNRDMSVARVYVSFFGVGEDDERAVRAAMQGLDGAAGFLRSVLGKRLHTPRVPELRFVHDQGPEMQQRLQELVRADTPPAEPPEPSEIPEPPEAPDDED